MIYQTPPSYKSRILKIFDFFFISSLPIVYLLLYLDINKLEMEKIQETKQEKQERMEYVLIDYYGSNFVEALQLESGLMKRSWNQDPLGNPQRDYLMMLIGAYKALKQNR